MAQRLVSVHDKAEIEAYCRQAVFTHLYHLGDLDDFFWPHTVWYGLKEQDALQALALLYIGGGLPVLLAHGGPSPDALHNLIASLKPYLPRRFYSHLDPHSMAALREFASLEPHGDYLKMALTGDTTSPDATVEIVNLNPADEGTVLAFYANAYPGNWFDKRMLETGCYYGARLDGQLACVAGIHVYSPRYRVAALGNIATLPAHRGRGLAQAVTARVCQHLRAQSIKHIGLNVNAGNAAAIATYQKLGFARFTNYSEHMVTLNS